MDKGRIKRSVVTCAVLVGLSVSPQAQAGWFSDRWEDITDSIEEIGDSINEAIDDAVDDVVAVVEDGIVYLLENGAGRGADYLIGLMLQLDQLDGHIVYDLLIKIMADKNIISDDILLAMMQNDNMIALIEKVINAGDTQARATEFFNLSIERMMPIMMDPNFDMNIIDNIPTDAYVMFSNLGSMADNDDALEKAWEGLLKNSMSNPQSAAGMFNILFKLSPQDQKSMMDFMFLAIDANGNEHVAQSVNFNQAMIEGLAIMMASDPEATMALFGQLMPILMTFDDQGNMTGMTPYGMRFMTVLGTKMMTCGDASAIALGTALGQMMPGIVPPSINETIACGRVEDAENIALLNAGTITYRDSDADGVPDFMDMYPGMDNSADIDNDGTPNDADSDMDGDGIDNGADVDPDGNGTPDNGTDTDNDGINNANDDDIDGDGIINEEDTDMDGDGIENDADADANGDGTVENGPDTDSDGINDANDSDIDGDGIDNDADADDDGVEGTDDDQTDTDNDGINDASDVDADGDGTNDNGTDSDDDGVNDDSDTVVVVNPSKITETIVYFYGEDGVLRDSNFAPVVNVNFNDDPNLISNVVIMLPGNKSVIMEVDMDILYTDEEGNRFIVSELLDDKGSRFIISMTADGFGKVLIGNDEGGFEMSGNLAGMAENEELVFSVQETEDGQLAGKTTIKPKNKTLTFGSSVFN